MTTLPLHIAGLTKTVRTGFLGRPKTLLSDVSFDVAEGSTVGFVGANGAGKSTTIRHIIGVARPTSGTVQLFGADPRVAAHRRGLGFLPETTSFAQKLSARFLLQQQAWLLGARLSDAELAARLEEVGLAAHAAEAVGTFSKGMRQRLGIALALVGEPRFLVLDEPMSGLDPAGREHVRRLIRAQAERGVAVMFSSHVLADVEALCTDVVVINGGRVVFAGGVDAAVGTGVRQWEIECLPMTASLEGLNVRRHGAMVTVTVGADVDALALAQRLRGEGATITAVRSAAPRLEERLLELLRPSGVSS